MSHLSHSVAESEPKCTVAPASLVGNAIEYYDFSIYGFEAALVLPHVFFPEADSSGCTRAAFATMDVDYVSRPLGAVIFGHFGDRIGRKPMLVITLLLMGSATMLLHYTGTVFSIPVLVTAMLVVSMFCLTRLPRVASNRSVAVHDGQKVPVDFPEPIA
mgnify:FL=1